MDGHVCMNYRTRRTANMYRFIILLIMSLATDGLINGSEIFAVTRIAWGDVTRKIVPVKLHGKNCGIHMWEASTTGDVGNYFLSSKAYYHFDNASLTFEEGTYLFRGYLSREVGEIQVIRDVTTYNFSEYLAGQFDAIVKRVVDNDVDVDFVNKTFDDFQDNHFDIKERKKWSDLTLKWLLGKQKEDDIQFTLLPDKEFGNRFNALLIK